MTLLRLPIVCALAVPQLCAQFDWTLDPTPPDLGGIALIYHAASDRTVMFGGAYPDVLAQPTADTWCHDGTAWSRLAVAAAPPPRSDAGVAYDSLRGRVLLFGGRNGNSVRNDLWSFDGSSWSPVAALDPPAPRMAPLMVYDSARDRVVLRGGSLSPLAGPSVNTLYEFDGTTWLLRDQGANPPPGGIVVYDQARAVTLLVAGNQAAAWDGNSWQPRSAQGLPANASVSVLLYDPLGQRTLALNPIVGNGRDPRVFAWQGSDWALVAQTAHVPPGLYLPASLDTLRGKVVACARPTDGTLSTWRYDGVDWQPVQAGPPSGRYGAAMSHDSVRQRMVMVGGISTDFRGAFELTGSTWLRTATMNDSSFGHAMAFDLSRRKTMLFVYDRMLEWDGATWNRTSEPSRPAAREFPAMVYDRIRSRLLLSGGRGTTGELAELWAWDGVTWSQLAAAGPSARSGAGFAFDWHRDRAVLFGGAAGAAFLADTWEYDGTAWQQVATVAQPPERRSPVQVYDDHRRVVLLFGGIGPAPRRDTWQWNGSTWEVVDTLHAPDTGDSACGAYDAVRRELVVFGGQPNRGETWRLRNPGLGSWTARGAGCDTGYGVATLRADGPLAIGSATALELSGLPNHFATLAVTWIGFDDQQWNGVALPTTLAALGLPQCLVLTAPAQPLGMAVLGDGTATAQLTVPWAPALLETAVFAQGLSLEAGVNRLATSNLLAATIGVR